MAYYRCGGGVPSSVKTLPTYKTASGSVATFETDMTENLISCVADIVATQSGSGKPSPSNPRAISGFDSGNLYNYAKYHRIIASALTPQTQNGITVTPFADGHFEISGTVTNAVVLYFNIPTFTIYGDDTRTVKFNNNFVNSNVIVGFINNSTVIDSWGMSTLNRSHTNYTAMSNKECNVLYVSFSNGVSVSGSFKVEFLVTNSGTAYNFLFGQTVYGGHFDNKGNLVVTDYAVLIGDLTWTDQSPANHVFTAIITGKKNAISSGVPDNLSCEIYDTLGGDYVISGNNNSIGGSIANSRIFVCDTRFNSASDFKTACASYKIRYKLATPTTLSITSQDIPTLLGENNIFSDTGDITAKYILSVGEALRQG